MVRRWNMLLAVIVISAFMMVPVTAQETAFELGLDGAGYSITIPDFVKIQTYELKGSDGKIAEVDAVVVRTPARDADGLYTLFEIATDNKEAAVLRSKPSVSALGKAGSFEGKFSNGKLLYRLDAARAFGDPSLSGLIDKQKGATIFTFDFTVHNAAGDTLYYAEDLYFVFDDYAESAPPQQAAVVQATTKVVINGEAVAFEAYTINDNNYFKLRDLAQALQGTSAKFEVAWNPAANAIELRSGQPYTAVGGELAVSEGGRPRTLQGELTSSTIYLDGHRIYLTAYFIEGNNYFKLRDVARYIDFSVVWDNASRTISIDTSKGYSKES